MLGREMISDKDILCTVMDMSIEFSDKPIQHYLPKSVRSEREIQIISAEINKLLSKGALEVTDHSDNEIISDIFLRDKKDGSHRMILNFKNLNMYAAKAHFKMDTLHTITKLNRKDCFVASIDLKDACYSVPISRKDRKYLRFLWQGTLFPVHMLAKWSLLRTEKIHQTLEARPLRVTLTGSHI